MGTKIVNKIFVNKLAFPTKPVSCQTCVLRSGVVTKTTEITRMTGRFGEIRQPSRTGQVLDPQR